MVTSNGPGKSGPSGPRSEEGGEGAVGSDLDRRRRDLEASLAAKGHGTGIDPAPDKPGSASGYGQALRLSSEFIAGVCVGAGIGWVIDRLAGTSPWGLIVFLMLGFGAGVLNVMRAAGMVAEAGIRSAREDRDGRKD
jgi:ATP synthase protein I